MRDRQATICKTCQSSGCSGPDFTKGVCAGYNPEPPVEEEIEQANKEAAESAEESGSDAVEKLATRQHRGHTGMTASNEPKETGALCGDCTTVVTCERCKDLRQEICDDFELNDDH